EYHGMLDGDEYVDKGKFKIGGGKLSLTYKDEDFGKQTDDYIFSRNGYDTIFISEDKDDKIEFKRVDIVNYKSTLKKARVVIDGNGGSGTKTENVKIGNKIVQPSNPTRVGYDFRGWWTTPKGYL
ncbi:MAG: InlB B-repeat-containing protein, partial [Clostridia bacterium]